MIQQRTNQVAGEGPRSRRLEYTSVHCVINRPMRGPSLVQDNNARIVQFVSLTLG
jgi:hypothetical protein